MNKRLEPRVPADVQQALAAPTVKALWNDLTPLARRDFISWIESAKRPETRKRRVESLASRLTSGKRRPCCYAIVPMSLYKALGEMPKAKVVWSTLTPTERRDFANWVDTAENAEARRLRVENVCLTLASGKKHL